MLHLYLPVCEHLSKLISLHTAFGFDNLDNISKGRLFGKIMLKCLLTIQAIVCKVIYHLHVLIVLTADIPIGYGYDSQPLPLKICLEFIPLFDSIFALSALNFAPISIAPFMATVSIHNSFVRYLLMPI